MNWENLDHDNQLKSIIEKSYITPQLLFKHSTRCSISEMAKARFERQWNYTTEQVMPYYLDLLSHRTISNQIAETFSVHHQSPQILLIKNGVCVFSETHNAISANDLVALI